LNALNEKANIKHTMKTDQLMTKYVAAIALADGESILRVRRAEPLGSRADYFTKYKVDIAKLNGGGTEPAVRRSIVVSVSSNSGAVTIDPSAEIPDLG